MHHSVIAHRHWSTASFGEAADTSPMELAALGEHLHMCRGARDRWFTLHCLAETLNGFMASRFVTSVAIGFLLVGLGSMIV